MKIVILLAGMGKRLGGITEKKNKSLIEVLGKPLIGYLLDRIIANNQREVVAIIGHGGRELVDYIKSKYNRMIDLEVVENERYRETNNMYSIWCARDILKHKEFIICNGDIILNKFILKEFVKSNGKSEIMLDIENRSLYIDSPGTVIKNNRIHDLGRHILKEDNSGYAIGLYKLNSNLSTAYFSEIESLVRDGRYNVGFHDPLIALFGSYHVYPVSTNGLSWTDVDKKEDIPYAETILRHIASEESKLYGGPL